MGRRRIVRGVAQWKPGQSVQYDCDYNGIYCGIVVETSPGQVTIAVHEQGDQKLYGQHRYQLEVPRGSVRSWVR